MVFEVSTLDRGVVRVVLRGRLDLDSALDLESQYVAAVSERKAAVVVDLTGLEFIASVGMRLLVQGAKAQRLRGGRLVLFNPNGLVRETLTMTGLSTIIPIHDDLAQACEAALAGINP